MINSDRISSLGEYYSLDTNFAFPLYRKFKTTTIMSKKAKIISITFVLLVVVLGFAQRPYGNNQIKPNSFQGGSHLYHQLNPEQLAELNSIKMQLALDWGEDEYKKAYTISLKFAESMKAAIEELKTEPGKPSPETIYKVQLKKLELLIDVKKQLKSFLTEEEIEKWTLIMMKY